jgi:WhiB family redox-sensing transcriptional regulator
MDKAEWSKGLCKSHDSNLWFSPSPKSEDTARAVAICNRCPIREGCLTHSLEWGEEGVWGGLTAKERKVVRRERGVTLVKIG